MRIIFRFQTYRPIIKAKHASQFMDNINQKSAIVKPLADGKDGGGLKLVCFNKR